MEKNTSPTPANDPESGNGRIVGRRTIVKGVAWSIPVIASAVAIPTAVASPGCVGSPISLTSYEQSTTVAIPACATTVTFEIAGGGGGACLASPNPQAVGGSAFVHKGVLAGVAGQTLTLTVGNGGVTGTLLGTANPGAPGGAGGRGYSNGGMGGPGLSSTTAAAGGGGGGGSSAILLGAVPLIVAAGGGGAGSSWSGSPLAVGNGGFAGAGGSASIAGTVIARGGEAGTATAGGAGGIGNQGTGPSGYSTANGGHGAWGLGSGGTHTVGSEGGGGGYTYINSTYVPGGVSTNLANNHAIPSGPLDVRAAGNGWIKISWT